MFPLPSSARVRNERTQQSLFLEKLLALEEPRLFPSGRVVGWRAQQDNWLVLWQPGILYIYLVQRHRESAPKRVLAEKGVEQASFQVTQ